MEFKVLSPGEQAIAWKAACGDNTNLVKLSYPDVLIQAQHKDTLRQVLEMVEGIENPNKIPHSGLMHTIRNAEYNAFNEAIQTIKQSLQQAIEEKECQSI